MLWEQRGKWCGNGVGTVWERRGRQWGGGVGVVWQRCANGWIWKGCRVRCGMVSSGWEKGCVWRITIGSCQAKLS